MSFLQIFTGANSKKTQEKVTETLTHKEDDEFTRIGKNGSVASLKPLVKGTMPSPQNDSIDYYDDAGEEGKQRSRIHAKHSGEDGSTNYQNETMGHYSVDNMGEDDNEEELIVSSSPRFTEADSRKRRMRMSLSQVVFGSKERSSSSSSIKPPMSPRVIMSPKSPASRASYGSPHSINSSQHSASASKQLISDLLWLEQKIAATNQATSPRTNEERSAPHRSVTSPSDSLSFASHDDGQTTSDDNNHSSGSSDVDRTSDPSSVSSASLSLNQSIICRDCYAPPGKLKIVIHSTKDGPAVHTVKKGSSLEGHIFPGDLIISVDNVDTRTYSAEQVMKMMTAKTRFERKITVLHFEDDRPSST